MEKREGKEGLSLKYRKSQFSEWYNQILQLAGIIDKRYGSKSFFVWMNYGYEIMLNIKRYWDKLFRDVGIKEMYFPLFVPIKYCEKNLDWWEGFKDQAFWVKGAGEKDWDHILRPTGEPAMYPMFSIWIRSYNDLPFRIYENVSSFRYETKHTRPIIRDREITLWHEIHTAHATKDERTEIYKKIGKSVAYLHSSGIIHGDLTTSNMIMAGGEIFFIDFGLGKVSTRIEDQATDLYLLYEAFKSTHFKILDEAWSMVLKTYKQNYLNADNVLKRIEKIKTRRRYK